jgi:hypothetical protein
VEAFDRHFLLNDDVFGQVDGSHSTLAEPFFDSVALLHYLAEERINAAVFEGVHAQFFRQLFRTSTIFCRA